MDEERLALRVARGASLAAIAAEFGLSRHVVRRRVLALGLETARMRNRRQAQAARAGGAPMLVRVCPRHGERTHRRDARGTYRCTACNGERVSARRRRVKEMLVAEAGSRCARCGYDRCPRALSFHHVDPASKAFGIAYRGHSRSIARARAEAAKCVLLCANCHAEVEAGGVVIG